MKNENQDARQGQQETNKDATCCSCEAGFKNEINELVDNVEGYGRSEQQQKEEELREAFSQDRDNKSDKK